MLIEFSVTNFRSFRAEQRLSLVASAADRSQPANLASHPGFGPRLLHSAVIYGPNASGKSNLIMALGFLHLLVLRAAERTPAVGRREIDHPLFRPFLLDPASAAAPTRFELHFLHDGVRYQYGIALDRSAISEEWLAAYPKGQPQTWFERRRPPAASAGDPAADTWYFGPRLAGEKQRLTRLSRADVPFLATGATFGNPQLRHVFDWFATRLAVLNPWGRPDLPGETARRTLADPQLHAAVRDLLAAADIGIMDFTAQEVPLQDDPWLTDAPQPLLSALGALDLRRVDLRMRHRAPALAAGAVELDRDDESLGTLRYFGIAGPIVDALRQGATLCIDEFDDSLHPLLVRRLVELFHAPETNPNHAQLVINTHDATLLDGQLFRRDQIWLTEKGGDGATALIPLSDYRPRKDESLMRGYLAGRYGAVPLLDELPTIRVPARGRGRRARAEVAGDGAD